jgi:hypothetical protein
MRLRSLPNLPHSRPYDRRGPPMSASRGTKNARSDTLRLPTEDTEAQNNSRAMLF